MAQARPDTHPAVTVARIAAAAALMGLTAWILSPFFVPLVWGAILAYATWPVYRRLPQRERRPRLWAAALTALVAVGIGLPVALLLVALADDATAIARTLLAWRKEGMPLPDSIAGLPWLGPLLEGWRQDAPRMAEWLESAGSEVSRRLVGLAGGVVRNTFKFSIAMLSLYFFYVSGERLMELGRRLAHLLFPLAEERFVESIGDSVRAVMFGLLGTALVQGLLAGMGLAVAGVPSPVALGAATALLSVLPGGGSAISLVAAAGLAFSGRWIAAIALAAWALLVVSSMDNLLRPILISERARIPFMLVFLGVLGGLAAFGVLGIFVGPVVLSVGFALIAEFSRMGEEGAGPPETGGDG